MTGVQTCALPILTGISNCGNTAQKSFRLVKLVSATPGLISGPTNPCIYIGSTDSATYTIRKIDGAASYNWLMPTGATAYHPAGLGENDTIVKVIYTNSLVSGSLISGRTSTSISTTRFPAKVFSSGAETTFALGAPSGRSFSFSIAWR